jgi:hypothetical protein
LHFVFSINSCFSTAYTFGCQFADIVVNLTGKPTYDVCGYFEWARKIGAVMAAFWVTPIPYGGTAHA